MTRIIYSVLSSHRKGANNIPSVTDVTNLLLPIRTAVLNNNKFLIRTLQFLKSVIKMYLILANQLKYCDS